MTPGSRTQRLALLVRTVRHLRPTQVGHRLRLRGQKAVFRAAPALSSRAFSGAPTTCPGWPDGFMPLDAREATGFPRPAENADHIFEFVGERRSLGHPPDWEPEDASQLWRYHLHYMEWLWSFVAEPDRDWARKAFRDLWQSWNEATVFGRWDAWSPYVVSLRAWALCRAYQPLVAGEPHGQEFLADLRRHARFIRANLEHDVGGNHLIKNLKGLLGTAVFLGDARAEHVALTQLERQLRVQVLADGGHFERSPSYHCQVLGDLIDMEGLLCAAGRSPNDGLRDAIARMRSWLAAILLPDGDVPLFNDCTLVGEERLGLLGLPPLDPAPLTVLADSGYIVAQPSPRVHIVIDVGPPCPPDLPAHAHADCLSFVMAVDGRRFLVDTGTSTYRAGWIRDHERSTSAHNTVEIDGSDQTEVWGAFRAARRAHPRLESATHATGGIRISASHDGYERLPGRPRHRRTWVATTDRLEILDEVVGGQALPMIGRLHFAPEVSPVPTGERFTAADCELTFEGGSVELIHPEADPPTTAWSASRFGERRPVAVIAHHTVTGSDAHLRATIRWAPEERQASSISGKGAS